VLGYDLLDICLNQPEKLSTTAFSQPAILVATLATVERERCAEMAQASFPPSTSVNIGAVTHAAGFSLGEYTALVFSGALTFEDGVRLIKSRAEGKVRQLNVYRQRESGTKQLLSIGVQVCKQHRRRLRDQW